MSFVIQENRMNEERHELVVALILLTGSYVSL